MGQLVWLPGLGDGVVRVWVVIAMAVSREKGEVSGSVERMGSEPSLEELLQSLDLKEEEINWRDLRC
jgi:hypothetical protein